MIIETLKFDTKEKLANVITLKTKRNPEGIIYTKRSCLELELSRLIEATENLRKTMKAYKIITKEEQ